MSAARIGQIAFFTFSYLLIAVSLRFLVIGGERAFPASYYQMELKPLTMTVHILASSVAMAVLPLQFVRSLRRAHPRLHRWLGRVCVTGVVLGGLSGANLALSSRYGGFGAVGFFLGASFWTAAAVIVAWMAAFGRGTAHRGWVIVLAALSLGAVTIRIEMPLFLVFFGLTGDFNVELTAWTCWALNLLVLGLWHSRVLLAGRPRRSIRHFRFSPGQKLH